MATITLRAKLNQMAQAAKNSAVPFVIDDAGQRTIVLLLSELIQDKDRQAQVQQSAGKPKGATPAATAAPIPAADTKTVDGQKTAKPPGNAPKPLQ